MKHALLLALIGALLAPFGIAEVMLGSHKAKYSDDGSLVPWISWEDAIRREMNWYARCPSEHGYPRFISMTFMDGAYQPIRKRPDCIPSTQNGMGIISYIKYFRHTDRRDTKSL